jgi:hypothetical protein
MALGGLLREGATPLWPKLPVRYRGAAPERSQRVVQRAALPRSDWCAVTAGTWRVSIRPRRSGEGAQVHVVDRGHGVAMLLSLAGPALVAGDAEQVGKTPGELLGGWSKSLYGGIAGLVWLCSAPTVGVRVEVVGHDAATAAGALAVVAPQARSSYRQRPRRATPARTSRCPPRSRTPTPSTSRAPSSRSTATSAPARPTRRSPTAPRPRRRPYIAGVREPDRHGRWNSPDFAES